MPEKLTINEIITGFVSELKGWEILLLFLLWVLYWGYRAYLSNEGLRIVKKNFDSLMEQSNNYLININSNLIRLLDKIEIILTEEQK